MTHRLCCFNPRVPRGTRPDLTKLTLDKEAVSIPASHAGRDRTDFSFVLATIRFNPRVPRGTRLRSGRIIQAGNGVSIPASHAGRDWRYRRGNKKPK